MQEILEDAKWLFITPTLDISLTFLAQTNFFAFQQDCNCLDHISVNKNNQFNAQSTAWNIPLKYWKFHHKHMNTTILTKTVTWGQILFLSCFLLTSPILSKVSQRTPMLTISCTKPWQCWWIILMDAILRNIHLCTFESATISIMSQSLWQKMSPEALLDQLQPRSPVSLWLAQSW